MNCSDNHLSLKQHLDAMLRVSAPLAGLPIVEVSGHEENALKCDLNHLTLDDLFRASIGVDSCGRPAIRVKYIASCDLKKTCTNNSVDDLLRSMFAYDSTTKTIALVLNVSV